MIDRTTRDRLATGLRQLASGRLTNDEFGDLDRASGDAAIREIWTFGWCHYTDLVRGVRLRGRRRLSRDQRRRIAQAVLFLRSDREYVHGTAMRDLTVLSPVNWLRLLPWILAAAVAGLSCFDGRWPGALIGLGLLYGLAMLVPHPPRNPDPSEPGGSIWPFASASALSAAIAKPVLLNGER